MHTPPSVCPGCTHPTCPSRTLGAGRTERAPPFHLHSRAGLSARADPPPPSLHSIHHTCTLPHPLRECGRDSAHPPFRSPIRLGCTHPACTSPHAGGRADRASPLPFCSRAGPSARAAPPGLCATRCTRALPHSLRECGGRGRRDSADTPFRSPLCPGYATPTPQVTMRPAPLNACQGGTRDGAPPPIRGQSPLPGLLSPSIRMPHHARTPSTPFVHMPEAQEGWGCTQEEGCTQGDLLRSHLTSTATCNVLLVYALVTTS